ncbi:MAG TPA: beta-ribofuranosylaminobenzene 5'-phosphate synthase [Burkholderiales bacterium]|nr:GHMP kinase [Betaproteobacteria bacterium]HQR51984.1 beta-ribofuranosylaminobenzene 5'-phosphate synthase [Burkholderiales bacterium]
MTLPFSAVRQESVMVAAPARLHLGFMDLSGGVGRRFGSLGLTLDSVRTRVIATPADGLEAEGPQRLRVRRLLEVLREATGVRRGIRVVVTEAIPEHAGLGSGTQLALAVGCVFARLFGLALAPREIAGMLDRGARSGIGIGAFEHGGFLVDGGRGAVDAPPPITSRIEFPENWRVLLILHPSAQGLHGAAEKSAFRALPPFPEARAAHLCRLVMMSLLPALAEHDLFEFGRAVQELQRVIGDHFAPAQGGRFASAPVASALARLEAEGVSCVGQSSWGPTGFAVVESEAVAAQAVDALEREFTATGLTFEITRGRNRGGEIALQPARAAGLNAAQRVRQSS